MLTLGTMEYYGVLWSTMEYYVVLCSSTPNKYLFYKYMNPLRKVWVIHSRFVSLRTSKFEVITLNIHTMYYIVYLIFVFHFLSKKRRSSSIGRVVNLDHTKCIEKPYRITVTLSHSLSLCVSLNVTHPTT